LDEFRDLAKFDTQGDPEREKLLEAAMGMANAIGNGGTPYSLTLLGPSGIGKTHLAKALYQWAKIKMPNFRDENGIWQMRSISYLESMSACGRFLGGEWNLPSLMEQDEFLVIDDLGTERDPKLTWRGEVQHVVSRRLGRGWTVLTSNLTYSQLTEYDARLASRLIREGGKVVMSKADDYCLTLLKKGQTDE